MKNDDRHPAGENWQLFRVSASKVLEQYAHYDAEKIVPFPPRTVPQGDNPIERMVSVAGAKIR